MTEDDKKPTDAPITEGAETPTSASPDLGKTLGDAPTPAADASAAETPSEPKPAASAPERVKAIFTGSVKGSADVLVGTTVAEALKLANITEAASNLNLRDSAGQTVKAGDPISQSVTYTAKGGAGESRVTASPKMSGG